MAKYRLIRRSIKIVGLIFALPATSAVVVKEMVQASAPAPAILHHKADLVDAAMKAAPPVAVSGAAAAGVQVNDLVFWATLFWILLQSAFLIYKWKRLHDSKDTLDEKK